MCPFFWCEPLHHTNFSVNISSQGAPGPKGEPGEKGLPVRYQLLVVHSSNGDTQPEQEDCCQVSKVLIFGMKRLLNPYISFTCFSFYKSNPNVRYFYSSSSVHCVAKFSVYALICLQSPYLWWWLATKWWLSSIFFSLRLRLFRLLIVTWSLLYFVVYVWSYMTVASDLCVFVR